MCVHINTLPDDCLLPIFDLIPLLDLFRLDQVCPRWAKLFPSACARRRTLVLIGSGHQMDEMYFEIPFNYNFDVSFDDGHQPYYPLPVSEHESSLRLPNMVSYPTNVMFDEFFLNDDESEGFLEILYQNNFTELARFHRARLSGQKLVTYFTDLFLNLSTLVVINAECDEKDLNLLIDLLDASSWTLRILKLWLYFKRFTHKYPEDNHPVLTLLHRINEQSSLLELTLDIGGRGFGNITIPLESYSFITKLKVLKLHLRSYIKGDANLEMVHQFDNPGLGQIGLGNDIIPSMEAVLSPKFAFTAKVNQFYGRWNFGTVEQFSEFCWRFPSLTTLRMVWSPKCTFTKLVTNLSLLSQLTHLKLFILFKQHSL